jgi:pyruvate,water dikinase
MVAADPALTALFDEGMDDLSGRLAREPAAAGFLLAFDQFLDDHGSRGPNEWEMACDVWGTRPDLPLAIVDRMRHAGEGHAPAVRAGVCRAEREAALADARSRLRGLHRWHFERCLRCAVLFSRGRELGKTMLVGIIHEARLAARELGRRIAERSGGGNPDDLWYVTYAEFADYRRDPAAFAAVVAARRATREALSELVPPFTFSGEMPPVGTWERRADRAPAAAGPGTVLTGIPGSVGVVRGRARVVTDAADPGDLGPGDVLVAPLTDPSWTPLFVPVDAVVVDVGGQMSHAVIVSRELGLPCVVSVTGATGSIPDGAIIEVDGAAGTVTVLEA